MISGKYPSCPQWWFYSFCILGK
uniref:Uncharacterized protein n=1 Tax=Anguilla anguilla TaxID=7936 RepID=A0A0E9TD95_ANGAN